MKSSVVPIESMENIHSRKEIISGLVELSKARLSLMVVLTSAAGYYMGYKGGGSWVLPIFMTIFGTGFLAIGAAALNQVIEKDLDSRMDRTQDRPLVTGLFSVSFGIGYGVITSIIGFTLLILGANILTALLGLLTLGIYLFVYTPLKTKSIWNTLVGAIPGALPPLMGWTAATGRIDGNGALLFMLLFAWQIPHFMAIAWMHKDDYAKAGYKMLPSIDPEGFRCGRHAVVFSFILAQSGIFMVSQKMVGGLFLVGGGILALGMVFLSIRFSTKPNLKNARALFFASIIYLPIQLLLMVFDKNTLN